MTKKLFIILMVCLPIFAVIFLLRYFDNQVSWKYEVDQARIFLKIDDKKPESQKKMDYDKLDQYERELFFWMNFNVTASIVSILAFVSLLIMNKRITRR